MANWQPATHPGCWWKVCQPSGCNPQRIPVLSSSLNRVRGWQARRSQRAERLDLLLAVAQAHAHRRGPRP